MAQTQFRWQVPELEVLRQEVADPQTNFIHYTHAPFIVRGHTGLQPVWSASKERARWTSRKSASIF